jgi:UDP-glucose 4-epimerase
MTPTPTPTRTRIYITGIAGFLGSHLADYFLVRDCEVLGCDDLSTGTASNVPHDAKWDLYDIEGLQSHHLTGVDIVFHCAAAAYEGVSVFSPAFISRNVYAGSAQVFSTAISAGVKRIVFTSSMARYGSVPSPYMELQTPCPVDPYGIAKEAAERLLVRLCDTHGVEWSIAVPHNIYGPRQRYWDPYRNVAAIMANKMLMGQQPYIYGDGSQTRCFSYIDDVVPTLALMGTDPRALRQIFNVGPDMGATSIRELGRLIARIVGIEYEPYYLPDRPCEIKHATCSAHKVKSFLGFEQKMPLMKGLEYLVDWIREKGPREFEYQHIPPLEIESSLVPKTWSTKSM